MNLIFTLDKIEKDQAFLSNHDNESLKINTKNLPENLKIEDKLLLHLEPVSNSNNESLAKKILNSALKADN